MLVETVQAPYQILNKLSPLLWAASLFDHARLTEAIGEGALTSAFRLPLSWLGTPLQWVGMSDFGAFAIARDQRRYGPESVWAPPGGLTLAQLLPDEPAWSGASHGYITARLPGRQPVTAGVVLKGPFAQVQARFPGPLGAASEQLLGALGTRCQVSANVKGAVDIDFSVHLPSHIQRARTGRPVAAGACLGFFLYGGHSSKSTTSMAAALEYARRDYVERMDDGLAVPPVACVHARAALEWDAQNVHDNRLLSALAQLICALDHNVASGAESHDPAAAAEIASSDRNAVQSALALTFEEPLAVVTPTRASPRAPTLSLTDAVSLTLAQLGPKLVAADAVEPALALAAALPDDGHNPNPLALELRFEREPSKVDILACWGWDGRGLVEPLDMPGVPQPLDRLPRLWAELGARQTDFNAADTDRQAPVIEAMDDLWLEFDAVHGGRPLPALFFSGRTRDARTATESLALTRRVVSALLGPSERVHFERACDAAEALLGQVRTPHIGLMFPRPQSPLRIVTAPGAWDDRSTVERVLGSDPSGRRLAAAWRDLGRHFAMALPALDIGPDGLLSTRGLEMQIDRGPLRRSQIAWQAPIRALVDYGLISSEAADAFAGSFLQRRVAGGAWLSVFPAYVKLAIDADGALSAKGYVAIIRSRVPVYEIRA